MDGVKERQSLMLARLQKRDEERQQQKVQRREQRTIEGKDIVRSGAFLPWLLEMKSELMKTLQLIHTQKGDNEQNTDDQTENLLIKLDELMSDYQQLQQTVTEVAHTLTPFEMEQSRLELQSLMDAIQSRKEQLQPKKKFTFGRARNVNTKTKLESADKKNLVEKPKAAAAAVILPESELLCGFKNVENSSLFLDTEHVNQRDVTLDKLHNCKIFIGGLSGSISMSHLTDCLCVCGPCYRSVWIEHCINCTFVIAGQQIRIHDSKKCNIYVCSRSGPIIENCMEMYFAPYTIQSTQQLQNQLQLADLVNSECIEKRWNEVEDFNHLVHDLHSPNWSPLPLNERQQFDLPQ